MDDTQTTGPATDDVGATQTPTGAEIASAPPEAPSGPPGFSERGRMRRRMRFLRKARELAYRDLGGLVFDLHRFGRRNDELVLAKLETIGRIDTELRALEATLSERRPVTVLREAGVAACPRCAAIHGSDDRFCPNCGLAMDLRAERPVAGPQATAQAQPAPAPPQAPMPMPMPAMSPTAVHATGQTPPSAPTGTTPPPAAPAPDAPAPSPMPSTVTPAPTTSVPATSVPAAPAQSPVPASTVAPAPATPTPRAPNPRVSPAPADASPVAPTPARDAIPAPDPAPAPGDDGAANETGPGADQPTEIVRPPIQDP